MGRAKDFFAVAEAGRLAFLSMVMAFFGHFTAQVPQRIQLFLSTVQLLLARSTVMAPTGQFLAQRPQ